MFALFGFIIISIFYLSYTDRLGGQWHINSTVLFLLIAGMLLFSATEIPVYRIRTKKPDFSEKEMELLSEFYSVPVADEFEKSDDLVFNSSVTLNVGGFILPLILAVYAVINNPGFAVNIDNATASTIQYNNFIGNGNASGFQCLDNGIDNEWHDGSGLGNYWSGYTDLHPDAMKNNGTWNEPYTVSNGSNDTVPIGDARDLYPLVLPTGIRDMGQSSGTTGDPYLIQFEIPMEGTSTPSIIDHA